MKFLQFKYLAFFPTLLIILYTIVKDIQNWHIPAYPMFMVAAPIILVYLIISLSYYFLKNSKEQDKYIDAAINFGIFILIIYTVATLLFYNSEYGIFNNTIILYAVFAYQILIVAYAVITGLIRLNKNM